MLGISTPEVPGVFAQKVLHQNRNVLAPFAQRWELEAHHVQAMEKVLAEFPLTKHGFQVAVGGGQDAHVHRDGLGPTYPLKGLLLEHAQEFHLRAGWQVADFVEEKRALVGLLEAADAPLVSAGEGPAFMAKEFALEQIFRDGCAIDGDEGRVGARAVLVSARAISSFPVPVSPRMRTVTGFGGHAPRFLLHTSCMARLVPTSAVRLSTGASGRVTGSRMSRPASTARCMMLMSASISNGFCR